jgi:hypothetical protein
MTIRHFFLRQFRRLSVTGLVLLLAHGAWAQAPSPPHKNVAPGFQGLAVSEKILLMPVDVELFSLSAGGVAEPRADWTAAALGHMKVAIAQKKMQLRASVVELPEGAADEFEEQVGLHAAVASSIALHHSTGGMWALPSKAGLLDWTFSDAMQPLQARSGARYGLFVWVRDSYATAERKAAMVALALLGVGVSGGVQIGYASLVDLQTGRVVWFNRLARATGDLREAAAAKESIEALLSNFPAPR